MHSDESESRRFPDVSRRAFIARGASVATGAAILGLVAACAKDDDSVLSGVTAAGSGTGAATSATTGSSTTSEPTSTTAADTTDGGALAGSMTVAFTYAASGGRVANPYVAVWVEDESGELVDTIALWFLQDQKGTRWLSDLRRWVTVDGSQTTVDTISGATRTPGDYSLSWDATDIDGSAVVPGTYTVYVEAAREHGPYSLTSATVDLASGEVDASMEADGEITDATVHFVAA